MMRPHILGNIAGLCTVALLASGTTASASNNDIANARQATSQYHRIDTAKSAGYELLRDAKGISCIDHPPDGAMGIHYVKGSLVGDGALNVSTPEALVYEPRKSGRMRLVAIEYVVFQAAWDETHAKPPSLYGRDFELVGASNRYGLPAFYELHVWLFKNNPTGRFNDYNPRVSC